MELKLAITKICFLAYSCNDLLRLFEWQWRVYDEIEIDANNMYLINPGSVGQPRDRDPGHLFIYHDEKLSSS
jgi:hypothetical protein